MLPLQATLSKKRPNRFICLFLGELNGVALYDFKVWLCTWLTTCATIYELPISPKNSRSWHQQPANSKQEAPISLVWPRKPPPRPDMHPIVCPNSPPRSGSKFLKTYRTPCTSGQDSATSHPFSDPMWKKSSYLHTSPGSWPLLHCRAVIQAQARCATNTLHRKSHFDGLPHLRMGRTWFWRRQKCQRMDRVCGPWTKQALFRNRDWRRQSCGSRLSVAERRQPPWKLRKRSCGMKREMSGHGK